jgi:carbamoyltransferase
MNILGIACHYLYDFFLKKHHHDSSPPALIGDGRVLAAAQEERFNPPEKLRDFPLAAVNYCLQSAGHTVYDLDCRGLYEKPYLKFMRVDLRTHLRAFPRSYSTSCARCPPGSTTA